MAREFKSGEIVTLAHGSIARDSCPTVWGDDGYAAIVFHTQEEAEEAMRLLAVSSLRAGGPTEKEQG